MRGPPPLFSSWTNPGERLLLRGSHVATSAAAVHIFIQSIVATASRPASSLSIRYLARSPQVGIADGLSAQSQSGGPADGDDGTISRVILRKEYQHLESPIRSIFQGATDVAIIHDSFVNNPGQRSAESEESACSAKLVVRRTSLRAPTANRAGRMLQNRPFRSCSPASVQTRRSSCRENTPRETVNLLFKSRSEAGADDKDKGDPRDI